MPNKLVEGHPSLNNSVLVTGKHCSLRDVATDIPKLPQTSPLLLSIFKIFWRYSTALWNCSCVRKIQLIAFMAAIDLGLERSACSYAIVASSKFPNNSAKLPACMLVSQGRRGTGESLTNL